MPKTKKEILLDSSHYLKSPLASLHTTLETLKLLGADKAKNKQKLFTLQEEKISELNFRLELFIAYLLSDTKAKKLTLEFFDLNTLVEEVYSQKPLEPRIEILSDREMVRGLLFYIKRFSLNLFSKSPKILIQPNKKRVLISFVTQSPQLKVGESTDIALEIELLAKVISATAKNLKGSFVVKGDKVFELSLPLRFSP